jgi:hypothetical protein
VNVTVPFPVPLAPPVTVIQGAFDAAVHEQAGAVDTVRVPVPPVAGNEIVVNDRL